jgi:Ca-activated chloride channel family protein
MKLAWLMILALLLNDPIKINKINTIKAEAKKAFQSGDYATAVKKYHYLIDSLGVKEDEVMLNLAHAYYLQKDTANALTNYQPLAQSSKRNISSKANLQLGLMANQKGKAEEALNDFKRAIKDDPTNEEARYNYEMLKKKLDEKKKQEQQQQNKQNKDQQKKDQQNKDQQKKEDQKNKDDQKKEQDKKDQQDKENKDQQNKDQQEQQKKEQEEKEQKEKQQKEQQEKQQQEKDKKEQKKDQQNLDRDKLEQMKISEEKAKMILEAMKNQEKQYLQQNKRKATKSRDRGKPDW